MASWADFDRDNPPQTRAHGSPLARLRGRGLHVASATDAPWTFPDSSSDRWSLTDDSGPARRPDRRRDGREASQSPETPPWLLDQLLTAEQGLRAVTLDAAWPLGDECPARPPGAGHSATSRS
jgi:predicted amidohydrolase YtcJ